ncbi:MAG: LamG-like jellyroll fold domain-containing protein, partial [bacterium]|nr:LamG-like jellyroll fold domain-containing protein [bacterium]
TQTASTGTLSSEASALLIGTDSAWFFNGLIDDVKIYNYARTPSQILVDYNQGLGAHFK